MEITANAIQTVAAGQDVLFTADPVPGTCCILHRDGSGIVTLRGMRSRPCEKTKYQVAFGGNIAVAEGGTAGPISLAISIGGEAIGPATGIATPAAVGDYFNVSMSTQVEVPGTCCVEVSVQNISGQAIDVQNANFTASRES